MVFEAGDKHLVAFVEECFSEAGGHQVNRLGGAAREDDLMLLPRVEQLPYRAPRLIVALGCPLAQVVKSAMDVGVILGIERVFGLNHLEGLLRGGGGVQVN